MSPEQSWLRHPASNRLLARDSARGVGSTAAGQLVLMALQMLAVMVLARVLTKDDFGVLATLLPLLALMLMLRDFGFQTTIVSQSDLQQQETSTYFWLNFGLSVTGAVAIWLVAPVIARVLNDPRLNPLVPLVSLAFLAGGLSATHDALLRRNLLFGRVQLVRITAYSVGVVVAIALGIRGHGAMSLAWQQLAEASVLSVGTFVACRWVPSLPIQPPWWPRGIRLAGALVMGRVVDYLRQNVDRALIRAHFSAAELGLYDRTYRIVAAPLQQAQGPLMAVALPALSRRRGTPSYVEYFLAFVRAIMAVTVPLACVGLVLPDEVVRLVLGERWQESASILRGLSLLSLSWPLMNLCSINFVVFESKRQLVVWPTVACAMAIAAFLIGVRWGAAGVATAYGVAFILLAPFQVVSGLRQGRIPLQRFLGVCAPPVIAILISTALILALKRALGGSDADSLARSFLLLTGWMLIYLAVLIGAFGYHKWLKQFMVTAFPPKSSEASGGREVDERRRDA